MTSGIIRKKGKLWQFVTTIFGKKEVISEGEDFKEVNKEGLKKIEKLKNKKNGTK